MIYYIVTLYNKQGVAFELEDVYCKHCASPSNTPENSDNEIETSISTLATRPISEGDIDGTIVVEEESQSTTMEPTGGVSVADKQDTTVTTESSNTASTTVQEEDVLPENM